MALVSIDPSTDETLVSYPEHDAKEIEQILAKSREAFERWSRTSFSHEVH